MAIEFDQAVDDAMQNVVSDQTIRMAIKAFGKENIECLVEKSHARHDKQAMIDEQGQKRLVE